MQRLPGLIDTSLPDQRTRRERLRAHDLDQVCLHVVGQLGLRDFVRACGIGEIPTFASLELDIAVALQERRGHELVEQVTGDADGRLAGAGTVVPSTAVDALPAIADGRSVQAMAAAGTPDQSGQQRCLTARRTDATSSVRGLEHVERDDRRMRAGTDVFAVARLAQVRPVADDVLDAAARPVATSSWLDARGVRPSREFGPARAL